MNSGESNPWRGIEKPSAGFNVLLVDADHPHAFFWGKDVGGRYLLMLNLTKDLSEFLEGKTVELQGVRTDITFHPATGEYFFSLKLQNKEDADIFYRLCLDLIERTVDIPNLKVALEVINNRLKRWKDFLRGKKKNLLSPQEIRGLFAELALLKHWLICSEDQFAILEGWQGPLDEAQDFVLGDFAVEVKSITGAQKDRVRISSEHQLSTHLNYLYLHVTYLAEFYDCSKGQSLNQMVESIRGVIRNNDAMNIFNSRLFEAGYFELKEYDSPVYSVMKCKTFLVEDVFPKIVPGDLKKGVSSVTYDLDLASLDSYVCELPSGWGKT